MKYRILVINVGSTSVKFALFDEEHLVKDAVLPIVDGNDTTRLADIDKKAVAFLAMAGAVLTDLAAIAARGGILRPVEGGTYRVNDGMLDDLKANRFGEHPSNLSAQVAASLVGEADIPVFMSDPVSTDEMIDAARVTGIPSIERHSILHTLSQKACARRAAAALGKPYDEANIIVAHMGGGISVGAHERGRIIDVNNALDGDGPLAPQRAGTIPAGDLVGLCFSTELREADIRQLLVGKGGVCALLGTSDFHAVQKMVEDGDENAIRIVDAMVLAIAKEVGARATVLKGQVDAIALTGGLVTWNYLPALIKERVEFIAPVSVYPENMENSALAAGALRVLRGEEQILTY